ncbi:hypothetical protein AQUSIP_02710 [Aquicella siphonis]|uniref:Helix-turn-helix domain-containing protein n=1 Tax=Aquicella siphonis TaxID=254247 RepID=A0A5E4PF02_9COXI|nr:DNA-binding protein [Aquicella siphonis]VVC74997.1 hypothetical protein AQUSIP_02710 [Aquicella siphonis]
MKKQYSRIEHIKEFELAPEWALFSQETVAAIRDCSLATLERERWIGIGIPFVKMGRLVRYKKEDVLIWIGKHKSRQSTSDGSVIS